MIGAQEKKIRRIMIAAPKSGSGKTMITCGLLQIFKENGEDISSCKCGPDYIDPIPVVSNKEIHTAQALTAHGSVGTQSSRTHFFQLFRT